MVGIAWDMVGIAWDMVGAFEHYLSAPPPKEKSYPKNPA